MEKKKTFVPLLPEMIMADMLVCFFLLYFVFSKLGFYCFCICCYLSDLCFVVNSAGDLADGAPWNSRRLSCRPRCHHRSVISHLWAIYAGWFRESERKQRSLCPQKCRDPHTWHTRSMPTVQTP